jgi:hypothetical protein
MIDDLVDAKFFIKKIQNQVFSYDKVVSFEAIIPETVDVPNVFEG